jgi:hypothetical protein
VRPFGTKIDLRFRLDTGELLDEDPRGVASKDLKNMKAALIENQNVFGHWRAKAQGDAVVDPPNASA